MSDSELPSELVDQFEVRVWEHPAETLPALEAAMRAELLSRKINVSKVLTPQLDETLALALQNGFFATEVYTELYNRYWPCVGRWVVRFGAEQNEALDLAQILFLSIYRRRLRTYNPEKPFAYYLRRSAYYLWVARGRTRRPTLPGQFDAIASPHDTEEEVIRQELEARLDEAVKGLPEDQRAILERTLQGHKPAAIAVQMELPKHRVFRLLWKARNALAAKLNIERPPDNRGRNPGGGAPQPHHP